MANDMRRAGSSAPLLTFCPGTFSAACLSCGRTLLVLLAVLSAVLRSIFTVSRNPPHPHHGRKRAVFVFAAFVLLIAGNARAQGTVAMDRAALEALYNATGGADWTDKTSWLSAEPLSSWHGVTTDGDGRVTKLELENNGLSGETPVELGNLGNLQTLNLSQNTLSGEIPEELGNLANLQDLTLWVNTLSGEIPVELGNLANLLRLDLAQNTLSGEIPEELGTLGSLQTLYLGNNELSGEIPVELGNLGSLLRLDLAHNTLNGEIPTELGNLGSLQTLSLWGNELSSTIPVELGNLGSLQLLNLSRNTLSGTIPVELGGLGSLQFLFLYRNTLSGEIPVELGNLGSLQTLNLSQNTLSGEIPVELGNLANLQFLYLWGNELIGEIPVGLGNLANLRTLYLFNNKLSGTIPVELGNLGNLRRLALSQNTLSGEIPVELGNLGNLQILYLWGNELSGTIPVELGGLGSLQFLSLSQNTLSGEIPVELGNLGSLLELYLNNNELSGEIPVELGNLGNLQILYLWGNELSGTIPVELGGLGSLQFLDLAQNTLSGEIPVELGNLGNLLHLYLNQNTLNGEIPTELGNLGSLQTLYLWGNELIGEIPVELGNLANLRTLHLSKNTLSGEIPVELGNLANLQFLYLWGNELSGTIPSWLVNLTELRELALWSNQLSGTIPPEVAPAQDRAALRVLYNATSGANWTDNTNWLSNERLSEWHGVSADAQGRIEELRLSGNGLNGMIGAELGVLTHLTGLYLDGNTLSGKIPPELENLAQLQVFDIRNTGLCVTAGSELQAWLATINFQGSVCGATPPPPPPSPPPPSPPPRGGGGGSGGGGEPRTSVPGAPTNLTAVGGDGEVVLSWDTPESDGGAEITDYEYRINGRNPWISIGSTDTTHTVTGLVNGTEYTFQVRAVNRVGKSFSPNQVETTPEAPEVFTLDFAHFANGTSITSDLVFVNLSTQPARPAIYFYDTEGALVSAESVVDVTGDLEITEDGGLTEMEPLGELTISTHGQGELVSGSVKVASYGPIGGMLRYDLPAIGEAVVGASQPVSDTIFPVRRQEGRITTGVAVHNLEEEAMEVSCELLRGGAVLEEVAIPLAANGQTSWLIDAAFPAADTSDFAGAVRCDAPGRRRFSAVALEMDPGTRVFITLPLFPVNRLAGGKAAVLDFAHFANGDGTTSDLVFVNLSTERSRPAPTPFHTDIPPIRPAIYFYDTEGNPIAAESVVDVTGDLVIQENGSLTVLTEMEPLGVLTVSTHGQGALVSGSVKVVSGGPIGGMLRYNLPHIGEAVVGASPPVSDAIFAVRRREGGITTGVALHNLESSPGLVHCDLLREGVLRDAASFPLEANGQSSWLIDQAFPGTDTSDFVGSVRCDAVGEGRFSAVALEMDPVTRIFTTLPVFPIPRRISRE